MNSNLDVEWPAALDERFEPIEALATGRMSTVVRSIDKSSDREVALKILHPHLVGQEAVRRRLKRELAAVRRLDHPATVRADDLIEDDELVALVLEFVEGESVRRRVLRDGSMAWEAVKPILKDLLEALEEAHEKGIWHRDLNADHVLIDKGGAGRVVGFGMARVDELVALTMHTQVLGSLEAMAPERILGMDYDGRADLYSVGAVAYEMLLGHPMADGTMRTAYSQATDDGLGFEDLPDELPEEARYVLERSLATDASARFATAAQMRRALEGSYDRRMWSEWASRKTTRCPGCQAPVIDGVDECFECGHELRRLVQNPGQGKWYIRIISPRQAFDPDVWYEQNTEPDYLPREVFEALIELLDSHEDTKQVVDWSPEYRWPPYVLFEQLTFDDSRHISELLKKREIPHEWIDEVPSRFARQIRRVRTTARMDSISERELIEPADYGSHRTGLSSINRAHDSAWRIEVPVREHGDDFEVFSRPIGGCFYMIFVGPIVMLTSMRRRNVLSAALVAVLAAGIWWMAAHFGLGQTVFWAGLGAFFIGFLVTRAGGLVLTRGLAAGGERPTIAGESLMVPTESLEEVSIGDSGVRLPRRTPRVLRQLTSDAVRREIHELLVLSVTTARRAGVAETEGFDELVDEILTVAGRLDEAVAGVEKSSTAELYAEVERLEAAIEAGEEGDELREKREEILEAIADHDRMVHRVARHRATLQKTRGALLDLLSDDEVLEERVMLSFKAPEESLARVSETLAARQEVG